MGRAHGLLRSKCVVEYRDSFERLVPFVSLSIAPIHALRWCFSGDRIIFQSAQGIARFLGFLGQQDYINWELRADGHGLLRIFHIVHK